MKVYNTVVLGGGGTGKSNLALRYMRETFVDSYDPSTEEQPARMPVSYRKSVEVGGQRCDLEVLDTAGADPFTSTNERYIRRSTAFILVFSLTQASSMSELENLRRQIFRVKGLPEPASFPIGAPKARQRRPAYVPGGGRTNYRPTPGKSDEDSWSIGEDLGEGYRHIPAQSTGSVPFVIVGTKCDLVDDRQVSREMAIRLATLWGVPYYETSARLNINVDNVFLDIVRQMREHDIAGTNRFRFMGLFSCSCRSGSPIQ